MKTKARMKSLGGGTQSDALFTKSEEVLLHIYNVLHQNVIYSSKRC